MVSRVFSLSFSNPARLLTFSQASVSALAFSISSDSVLSLSTREL